MLPAASFSLRNRMVFKILKSVFYKDVYIQCAQIFSLVVTQRNTPTALLYILDGICKSTKSSTKTLTDAELILWMIHNLPTVTRR